MVSNTFKANIKVVVFDFDGVLVDSNQLKYDAFFQLFTNSQKMKNIVEEVMKNYREESRFFIIHRILELSGFSQANINNEVERLAQKYNEIIQQQISQCGLIPSVRDILEQLYSDYVLYLNSTTPIKSLQVSVNVLGIKRFFKELFGGPADKVDNLQAIIQRENIERKKVVVIGDGKSDLEAAERCECYFIGIRNKFNQWKNNELFPAVRSLKEVIDMLSNLSPERRPS